MSRAIRSNEVTSETSEKAKKVPIEVGQAGYRVADLLRERQLVSFGERVTYTFVAGKEVGSIHFDRRRGEIFYKGHNVCNMEPEEWQYQEMEKLRQILSADEACREFAPSYGKTLDKIIMEKRRR